MKGASKRRSRHEGVRCDGCSRADFPGKRYKCLICYDHDVCETCYEAEVTDTNHKIDHAVQCILTPADYELYYAGGAMEKQHSFTCPMCATMGFTLVGLRQHLKSEHGNKEMQVVCPVCAVTAGAHPDIMTVDLAVHLALEHISIVDDHFLSRCLETIPATSARGTAGSSARGRRPPSSVSVPSPSPSDMDSTTLSGLLSEMSTGPQRTSALPAPGGTEEDIETLRIRLQAAGQQLPTPYHQHDRPRHFNPFSLSRKVSAFPGARVPPPVSVHPKPTLVEAPARNDPRFLLSRLVEEGVSDSQQQEVEVERSNRTLFAQELLLSTLEAQAPAGADGQSLDYGPASALMNSAEQALTPGTDPSATTILENTTTVKQLPIVTSPKLVFTTTAESTVVANPEPTAPPSLQPTVATSTQMSATTRAESTDLMSPPLAVATSPDPTVRSSAAPTSTTSPGATAAAISIPVEASPVKGQAPNTGSTAPLSAGGTAASSVAPTDETTDKPTVAPCPGSNCV